MSPPPARPPSARRLVAVALAALAAGGCGLADYERKMQEAEARLQRFDDENRVLGAPLVLPPRTDAGGPTADVFLRPPKGVSPNEATAQGELEYHYPAPATGAGVCTDLYLAFGGKDEGREKLEREVETRLGVAAQNWQPVEIRPPGRAQALTFDAVEFYDPRAVNVAAVFTAYVHQAAGQPAVGVVFRVTEPNRAAAKDAEKMSLETFAEGGDAAAARAAWGRRGAH